MPHIIWTESATQGLVKNFSFLDALDSSSAKKSLSTIINGVKILGQFPYAGRPSNDLEPEHKELLIPCGSSGYMVLYEVMANQILILAVKHQKEAGY